MSTTLEEAKTHLPLTEDWLRNEAGWTDRDFESFGAESTQRKAALIANDILDIRADVSFTFDDQGPSSADECAEWAVEHLWDVLGWDQYENPEFVRFSEHPEWDAATINRLVKKQLETQFEEAGVDWWEANTDFSYF